VGARAGREDGTMSDFIDTIDSLTEMNRERVDTLIHAVEVVIAQQAKLDALDKLWFEDSERRYGNKRRSHAASRRNLERNMDKLANKVIDLMYDSTVKSALRTVSEDAMDEARAIAEDYGYSDELLSFLRSAREKVKAW
jgi:hypothetical protein